MPSTQKDESTKEKRKGGGKKQCAINCSAEGMWTNGACIGSNANPIHLTFFNKEYATVNTVIGSTQPFPQCIKLHCDLRSLREEKKSLRFWRG